MFLLRAASAASFHEQNTCKTRDRTHTLDRLGSYYHCNTQLILSHKGNKLEQVHLFFSPIIIFHLQIITIHKKVQMRTKQYHFDQNDIYNQ